MVFSPPTGGVDDAVRAISGMSAGISQISNARGSGDAVNPFLYLVE